jgi:hypothetical protein
MRTYLILEVGILCDGCLSGSTPKDHEEWLPLQLTEIDLARVIHEATLTIAIGSRALSIFGRSTVEGPCSNRRDPQISRHRYFSRADAQTVGEGVAS